MSRLDAIREDWDKIGRDEDYPARKETPVSDCICGARGIDLEGHECIPSLREQLAASEAQLRDADAANEIWKELKRQAEVEAQKYKEQLAASEASLRKADSAVIAALDEAQKYRGALETIAKATKPSPMDTRNQHIWKYAEDTLKIGTSVPSTKGTDKA